MTRHHCIAGSDHTAEDHAALTPAPPLPNPDWEDDDGRFGWMPRGPFDVIADGTSSRFQTVTVRCGQDRYTLDPDEARAVAAALIAAATEATR